MNLLANSRCHEGPNRLTFPDILSDPLVRAMMAVRANTITWEITTRIGARVRRVYV